MWLDRFLTILLNIVICVDIYSATPFNGCPDFSDINASYVTPTVGCVDGKCLTTAGLQDNHFFIITDKSKYDENTGNQLKCIPDGEDKVVELGMAMSGAEFEGISYDFTPSLQTPILLLRFAIVMQDPGHSLHGQPKFVMQVTDGGGQLLDDCTNFSVSSHKGMEGFNRYEEERADGLASTPVMWRDWSYVGIDLSNYIGQNIRVTFKTLDCLYGAHYGYAYFTAKCIPNHINIDGCNTDNIIFKAPRGFYGYKWDNGDTDSISYRKKSEIKSEMWCDVTSFTGCTFRTYVYTTDRAMSSLKVYENDTICQGDQYNWNGIDIETSFTDTKTFPFTFFNYNTCQSQDCLLKLTSKERVNYVFGSICEGQSYKKNGFNVEKPPVGVYHDTINLGNNKNECQAIKVLRLVVSPSINISAIEGPASPCLLEPVEYKIDGNALSYKWEYPSNAVVENSSNGNLLSLYFTNNNPGKISVSTSNGCGNAVKEITIRPEDSKHTYIKDTICVGSVYNKNGYNLGVQETSGYFTHVRYLNDICNSTETLGLFVMPSNTTKIVGDSIICLNNPVSLIAFSDSTQEIVAPASEDILIGDVICTDSSIMHLPDFLNSGKTAASIVFSIDETGKHGLSVAINDDLDGVYQMYDAVISKNRHKVADATTMRLLMFQIDNLNNELSQINGADLISGRYWTSTNSNNQNATIDTDMIIKYLRQNYWLQVAKYRQVIEF